MAFRLAGVCVVFGFVVVVIVVVVCLPGFGFDFVFCLWVCLCDLVFCCALWVGLLGGWLLIVVAAYCFGELLVFVFFGLGFGYLIVFRLVCSLFVVCLLLRIKC